MNENATPSAPPVVRRRRKLSVTSPCPWLASAFELLEESHLQTARALTVAEEMRSLYEGAMRRLSEQAPPVAATPEVPSADPVMFLLARTEQLPDAWVSAREMWRGYLAFAAENQWPAIGRAAFGEGLKAAGLRFWPRPGGPAQPCGWLGCRLLSAAAEVQPADVGEFLDAGIDAPGGSHAVWERYRLWARDRLLPALAFGAFCERRRDWESAHVVPKAPWGEGRVGHAAEFLAARADLDPQGWVTAADLRLAYLGWASQQRVYALSSNQFGPALRAAGLRPNRSRRDANGRQVRTWEGISLRPTGARQLRLVEAGEGGARG